MARFLKDRGRCSPESGLQALNPSIAYARQNAPNKSRQNNPYNPRHLATKAQGLPLSRWFTLNDRENRPTPFGLKDLMKYFEYKAYKEYPHKGVTTILSQVLKQLMKHEGDVQRLTPPAASRWKELLDYNKQDVMGLMYVMNRAKLLAL